MKNKNNLNFFTPSKNTNLDALLINAGISAGFPSPAGDFKQERISLDQELIKNKEATFCVKVEGTSMTKAGINSGDIMLVDRSLDPKNRSIVLAVVDNEFTVKRVNVSEEGLFLMPENADFNPIKITSEMNFQVWGVVTYIIHKAN